MQPTAQLAGAGPDIRPHPGGRYLFAHEWRELQPFDLRQASTDTPTPARHVAVGLGHAEYTEVHRLRLGRAVRARSGRPPRSGRHRIGLGLARPMAGWTCRPSAVKEGRMTYNADHIVASQLALFDELYGAHPATDASFRAAGVVAWLATFAPWTISERQQQRFGAYVSKYLHRSDYRVDGWWRTATLEAAHYSLTDDLRHLDGIILNLDHHNSGLRLSIYEALSFVIPRVHWHSPQGVQLRLRVKSHVERRYFYSDRAIVLALSMDGDAGPKRKWLQELDTREKPHVEVARVTESIAKTGTCANPMSGWLFEITAHVCAHVIESTDARHAPPDDTARGIGQTGIVAEGVRGHPLMQSEFAMARGHHDGDASRL